MSAPKPLRTRELAKIHLAAKQLGLDRETYEAMLFTLARVRSAGELDIAGRAKVLAHLQSRGAKIGRPRQEEPVVRKIRALWLSLRDAGLLRDASERALNAFVKRQVGVASPTWCSAHQANQVIEALKAWLERKAEDPRP